MIRKIAAALGAGALIAASRTAFAIDAVAVEAGGGEQRTNLLRVAIVDKWRRQHDPDPPQWRLAGYWEISGALWDNPDDSTLDVGFTPVFRIVRHSYYVEAAIGVHLVPDYRSFSTTLQFGSRLGAGFAMAGYTIGIQVQHLSNAGIKDPNPGINFAMIRVQYELE
jgi:hypothetical protein